ncbi:MAG: M20 family metallopeptidase [Candidatus Lokiarchaeota archaeon]|nr:M20 family metallopeptidase [Candidatus Lokiarchaeota archaeon]
MEKDLILDEIEKNREEYIEFLRDLIQTESYNPPGNEKNVALVIKKYLEDANIECEIFPFGENRANLFSALNNRFDRKNLLYNGHMDVVPPGNEEEWKYPPLSASIKRKKIFGRGATDMKGGLAAMIISLKILKKLDLKLSGNLLLNAVADEETGGTYGTGWCLENKLNSIKSDFVIIGEPTGLSPLPKGIILGEKGRVELKIVTNGISCHASVPFMGKNAIYMMSEIIQNLDKLEENMPKVDPPMSVDELKEQMSVVFPNNETFENILQEQAILQDIISANAQFAKNLTMIKGGIKSNVIPDSCEAIMDFRLLPGQTTEHVLESMKKLIKDLGYDVKNEPTGSPEDVFVYLEVLKKGEASYWQDWRDSKDLETFHSIVGEIYKKKPIYFILPASSDAEHYRNTDYCQPTILFGPGSPGTAHATDEYIVIQDFIDSIKVFSLFAVEFLK